jgi:hypothetical protein
MGSLMVRWSRVTLVFGFIGAGSPHSGCAQIANRWSSDAVVGGAIVKGGDFLNRSRAAASLSVAEAMTQRGRFAAYAEASYDWFGQFGLLGGNPDLLCIVDRPGAGCEPPYPEVAGPSASLGVRYAPSTRLETRVAAGGAAYSVDGTRVGAAIGQLDVTAFPAAHLGVILRGRFVTIPRYRHDRLTMVPVVIGLRVR